MDFGRRLSFDPERLTSSKRAMDVLGSRRHVHHLDFSRPVADAFVVVGLAPSAQLAAEPSPERARRRFEEPEVQFSYPEGHLEALSVEHIVDFCFPRGVSIMNAAPRTTDSIDLCNLLTGSLASAQTHHVFMLTREEGALYGVCVLTTETIDEVPSFMEATVAADGVRAAEARAAAVDKAGGILQRPGGSMASRCYCLLSRYPYFKLHFDVLNHVLAQERLYRLDNLMRGRSSTLISRAIARSSEQTQAAMSPARPSPSRATESEQSSASDASPFGRLKAKWRSRKARQKNRARDTGSERDGPGDGETDPSEAEPAHERHARPSKPPPPLALHTHRRSSVSRDVEAEADRVLPAPAAASPAPTVVRPTGSASPLLPAAAGALTSSPVIPRRSRSATASAASDGGGGNSSGGSPKQQPRSPVLPARRSTTSSSREAQQARAALREGEQAAETERPEVMRTMEHYFAFAAPQPGQVVRFDPRPSDLSPQQQFIQFRCPIGNYESHLMAGWGCMQACKLLSVDNLLLLMDAALQERRIVIYSPDVGLTSAVCLSLISFLAPFLWEGMFVPVLPFALHTFLEAPVPYIAGIMVPVQVDEAVFVDLTRDRVTLPPGRMAGFPSKKIFRRAIKHIHALFHDVVALPSGKTRGSGDPATSRFRAVASQVHHVVDADQQGGIDALVRLFERQWKSLVPYETMLRHTIRDMNDPARPVSVFMKDSFLSEVSDSSAREFMSSFLDTQLFHARFEKLIGSGEEDAS